MDASEGGNQNSELLALQRIDEASTQLQQQGNYLGALECMERGLVLRQHFFGAESDEVWRACKSVGEMCNLLAMTYLQQQDFDMVLELLKKAEILTERDDAGRAVTFNNLACYFRRQGKLNAALTNLQKALKIEARLKKVDNSADTHLNMCAVLSQLGHHQAGLEHAQSALILMQEELFTNQTQPISQKLDRVAVLSIAYHNIGVEQEFLKKYSASLGSYRKGVEVAEQHLGAKHGICITLKNSMIAAKKALAIHQQKQKLSSVNKKKSSNRRSMKTRTTRNKDMNQSSSISLLQQSQSSLMQNTVEQSASETTIAQTPNRTMNQTREEDEVGKEEEEEQELAMTNPSARTKKSPLEPPNFPSDSTCIAKKHLTTGNLFASLSSAKTSSGFDFAALIRSASAHPDSGTGVFAGDADSYKTFAPLLRPIVQELHQNFTAGQKQPISLDTAKLDIPKAAKELMVDGDIVRRVIVSTSRSVEGYSFSPHITPEKRDELEGKISAALDGAGLDGKYTSLAGNSSAGALRGDRYADAAGCNRDWPEGRGIFRSADGKVTAQVNCVEHLVITSDEVTGDIPAAVERLATAIDKLTASGLKFAFDDELGYLNSRPADLGTALQLAVQMCLPVVSKEPSFVELLDNYDLTATKVDDSGIFEIRNKHCMGISETKLVQNVFDGVSFFATIELQQREDGA
jgi:tetratricopeptide (TPR) repeat protein